MSYSWVMTCLMAWPMPAASRNAGQHHLPMSACLSKSDQAIEPWQPQAAAAAPGGGGRERGRALAARPPACHWRRAGPARGCGRQDVRPKAFILGYEEVSLARCTCWLPRMLRRALRTSNHAGLCRPQDGDSAYCSPDGIARRMAAGEAVSVRELPAPRFPALATLGFAPASYPSRPRDAPVRPGPCCGPGTLPPIEPA